MILQSLVGLKLTLNTIQTESRYPVSENLRQIYLKLKWVDEIIIFVNQP